MNTHRASNISCNIDGCSYTTKKSDSMAKHQATIHGKLSAQHHNSLTDDQGEIDPLDDINKSGIHENCRDCDEDEEALEDDEEGEAIEVDEDEEGIGIIDPLHKFPKVNLILLYFFFPSHMPLLDSWLTNSIE